MVAAVLVAMVLAIGVGAGAFSSLVPTPGAAPIAAAEARVVVVEPGDSVWSIARSLQPEGDVRPLVHTIVQANGAEPLQPGQEILVPR
jgi:nucleoid-associated protein YgaU